MTIAAKPPMDSEKMIDSARLSARLRGCVCDPDIRLRELQPKVFSAEVRHDGWCPMAGGQVSEA